MTDTRKPSLSYKDAGVDIDAGDALVDRIGPIAKRTRRPEVMGGLGGFGALCAIPSKYREPILVSGTDGVGTKLKLAMDLARHDTIGIDLVAMCVNDLLVCGAEPLFFLDYYATGKLNVETAASVIAGIGKGCELSGAALVGGETAEMPGMYHGEDYDLAGFCVGVVEKSQIIDGKDVGAGDVVLGLASSGPHSNGYSLIRKIIEVSKADLSQKVDGRPLADALMEPTRIYVKQLLKLGTQVRIKAMAHITGGGITENLPRVLPPHYRALIDTRAWRRPEVFSWLQEAGGVDAREMFRTFNCGIGMCVIVAKEDAAQAKALLEAEGETVSVIGRIEPGDLEEAYVELTGIA